MNNRVIFHIDINAFYATVEEIDHPEYRNQPIAVAPARQQAIITTCNYVARSFGVKSAMSVLEAKKLCPQLVVTGLHFDRYHEVSESFISLCESFCEVVEVASIDECYLDMSETIKQYKKPLDAAMDLQKIIQKELQLKVSIGIASNKFLAKVASDLKKPNGVSIIRDNELASKLWPLPLPSIVGVGKKMYEVLSEYNIHTVYDLVHITDELLAQIPINVRPLIDKCHGIDQSIVNQSRSHKSMGQSRSLGYDCDDEKTITLVLQECVSELVTRANQDKLLFKNIVVGIKDDGFENRSKSHVFELPTQDFGIIYEHVNVLFDQLFEDSVRHISVSCTKMIDESEHFAQLSLFNL
ncbi:MAG: DNA polymerase IV [Erysipelothrix sp.]|nr:DNA polymerase IV [Erysipelothrix sp.]